MGQHWLRDPYGCIRPVDVPDDWDEFAKGISETFDDTSIRFDEVSDNSISVTSFNDLQQRSNAFEAIIASLEARIQNLEERLQESMPLLF